MDWVKQELSVGRKQGPQTRQAVCLCVRVYVCVRTALSNYSLPWCVETKVYHNRAQVMTPYTTCIYVKTCMHTHKHTTPITIQSLNSYSVYPLLKQLVLYFLCTLLSSSE